MASTATQLTSVQTLIASIEAAGVAGYTQNNQTFTYQDLAKLYEREEKLLSRLRAENGGGFSLAQPITD